MTERRRRILLAVLAMAVAAGVCPRDPGEAQPPRTARLGVVSPFSAADTAAWHDALRAGLRDLGWVEDRNLRIDYRYADGVNARLPALVTELVALRPDVIVTSVTPDTLAAHSVTKAIPIVGASVGDPVAVGLVQSLARPGGNVTGLSQMAPDLAGKRLELLKAVVPRLARVAVLWSPADVISRQAVNEIQAPARTMGIELVTVEARAPADFEKAFDTATRVRAGAMIIMPGPIFVTQQKRLAELALRSRLPSVFHLREFAEVGGLLAYGPDRADAFRRVATYVDKILKGARPADLPVERPTTFELTLNVRTASALGLRVPPEVRVQANKVIE